MLVRLTLFDPDSFVFPEVSRIDERTAQLLVFSEGGDETPARRASPETLNNVRRDGTAFDSVARCIALSVLDCPAEHLSDEDRSCALTMSLVNILKVSRSRVAMWFGDAKLSFQGLLPPPVDESFEAERDFRRESLLLLSQMIRSDEHRLRRIRGRDDRTLLLRTGGMELQSIMLQLIQTSTDRYETFCDRFGARARSLALPHRARSDEASLLRSEVDAVLRAGLDIGIRNERLRCLGYIAGMSKDLLCCIPAWARLERTLRRRNASWVPPDVRSSIISEMNAAIKRHRLKKYQSVVIKTYCDGCATQEIALLASAYYIRRIVSDAHNRELYEQTVSDARRC